MRLFSIPLLLLFILAAAVAAPHRSHAAETFESGEADSVRRTAKGFTLSYSRGGDGWDEDVPRSSPAHARVWLAQWLVQRGNNTPFAYVWLVFKNKKLADLYAEALLEKAEKKNGAYVLTCNFSGQGDLHPRRAELFISPANPLYKKAPEIIAAMKAADPGKQAVLVQFEKEMELLNYRIVAEQTAMGLPPEGANAAPPDPEQEAAMAAVGEFLKNYHAGYLVGKIGAKEFIAICDAEMAQKHTGKDPRHAARVLAARSQAYKDTGDMARAQADAEAAVAADAQNDDAHNALAQAYAGQGKYDKALESLEKAKAVTPVAQRKQRYEEQARAYRTLASPQARAVQGVWKVDPHRTLDSMDDKDHWRRDFERNDTHPNALFIAFDLEKSICKRHSSNVTEKITGVTVQKDGKTVVIRCGHEKEDPLVLTPLGDSGLMLTRAGRGWRQDWYYKKIADNPARYYTNWKYTEHARSDMFLTSDSPAPAWMDKRNMPTTPAETKPAAQPPQSNAAPSGKGGGLARLDGVWYFDPEASVARDPKHADSINSRSLVKVTVDVSAKKLAVHRRDRDNPTEVGFTVSSDDGSHVVLEVSEKADRMSFAFVDDSTVTVNIRDSDSVFTRKEPYADILSRFNGVWNCDLTATKKRSPEGDFGGVEALSISVDGPGKTYSTNIRADGKNSDKGGGRLVVKSSGPQSAVITMNGEDMRLEFLDNDTLVLIPVNKPQQAYVLRRAK